MADYLFIPPPDVVFRRLPRTAGSRFGTEKEKQDWIKEMINQTRFAPKPMITLINNTLQELKIQNGSQWVIIPVGKKKNIEMSSTEVRIRDSSAVIKIHRPSNRLIVEDESNCISTHADGFTFTVKDNTPRFEGQANFIELAANSMNDSIDEPEVTITQDEPEVTITQLDEPEVTITQLEDEPEVTITQLEDEPTHSNWDWAPIRDANGQLVAQRNKQTGQIRWL